MFLYPCCDGVLYKEYGWFLFVDRLLDDLELSEEDGSRFFNFGGLIQYCIILFQPLNCICRGSSSDTTANKINPYYLIG